MHASSADCRVLGEYPVLLFKLNLCELINPDTSGVTLYLRVRRTRINIYFHLEKFKNSPPPPPKKLFISKLKFNIIEIFNIIIGNKSIGKEIVICNSFSVLYGRNLFAIFIKRMIIIEIVFRELYWTYIIQSKEHQRRKIRSNWFHKILSTFPICINYINLIKYSIGDVFNFRIKNFPEYEMNFYNLEI